MEPFKNSWLPRNYHIERKRSRLRQFFISNCPICNHDKNKNFGQGPTGIYNYQRDQKKFLHSTALPPYYRFAHLHRCESAQNISTTFRYNNQQSPVGFSSSPLIKDILDVVRSAFDFFYCGPIENGIKDSDEEIEIGAEPTFGIPMKRLCQVCQCN